jgi:hypothetical protein
VATFRNEKRTFMGPPRKDHRCSDSRLQNEAGNVIETHEHAGEFKEW